MPVRSPLSEHAARLIVAQRSHNRCEVCAAEGTNVHHRVKAGRVWRPANLVRLCGSGTTGCHGRIEHHPEAAQLLGLWLPSTADAAAEPMLCRPIGWWLAWWQPDDDGMWQYDRDATADELQLYAALSA